VCVCEGVCEGGVCDMGNVVCVFALSIIHGMRHSNQVLHVIPIGGFNFT
jgi:hypothetical protein